MGGFRTDLEERMEWDLAKIHKQLDQREKGQNLDLEVDWVEVRSVERQGKAWLKSGKHYVKEREHNLEISEEIAGRYVNFKHIKKKKKE